MSSSLLAPSKCTQIAVYGAPVYEEFINRKKSSVKKISNLTVCNII
jgi:hypothetical protein